MSDAPAAPTLGERLRNWTSISHQEMERMFDEAAALIEELEAENARLKRNLNSRDEFIVQSGQWSAFTDQLPNVVEPEIGHCVWYRGWECGYDVDAALWGAEGWRAYKGGADIDAPHTSARTFKGLIEEIDETERECPSSPDGRHQVDTSMESGPNNCFHCEARLP